MPESRTNLDDMATESGPTPKPIHSLILDAGPIIKGEPSVSTLLQQCNEIVCSPAVLAEIRDLATRQRVETTLKPFLILRTPTPESVRTLSDFAKKTGDIAVLSKTDIQLLALAYEVEVERNAGDWRLRKVPGQKRINGCAPAANAKDDLPLEVETEQDKVNNEESLLPSTSSSDQEHPHTQPSDTQVAGLNDQQQEQQSTRVANDDSTSDAVDSLSQLQLSEFREAEVANVENEDSDSDGWITPSNIKRKQLEEDKADASKTVEPKVMQVAMITTDFAMQNVLLQMNLNLLSPSLQRVRHIKTFVLRCHACFTIVRDMTKQFCTRCGGDTLTRVTCSTNHKGEFQLHLKKNFQWNNRGAKFSIPKPVAGASNQRVKGGGKGGWGNSLILSEDQKEYIRAMESSKREKRRDLMDEDYLPSILTGDRSGQGGRIRVGAGKHVNSRKR